MHCAPISSVALLAMLCPASAFGQVAEGTYHLVHRRQGVEHHLSVDLISGDPEAHPGRGAAWSVQRRDATSFSIIDAATGRSLGCPPAVGESPTGWSREHLVEVLASRNGQPKAVAAQLLDTLTAALEERSRQTGQPEVVIEGLGTFRPSATPFGFRPDEQVDGAFDISCNRNDQTRYLNLKLKGGEEQVTAEEASSHLGASWSLVPVLAGP